MAVASSRFRLRVPNYSPSSSAATVCDGQAHASLCFCIRQRLAIRPFSAEGFHSLSPDFWCTAMAHPRQSLEFATGALLTSVPSSESEAQGSSSIACRFLHVGLSLAQSKGTALPLLHAQTVFSRPGRSWHFPPSQNVVSQTHISLESPPWFACGPKRSNSKIERYSK